MRSHSCFVGTWPQKSSTVRGIEVAGGGFVRRLFGRRRGRVAAAAAVAAAGSGEGILVLGQSIRRQSEHCSPGKVALDLVEIGIPTRRCLSLLAEPAEQKHENTDNRLELEQSNTRNEIRNERAHDLKNKTKR